MAPSPVDDNLGRNGDRFILELEFVQCLSNPSYLSCNKYIVIFLVLRKSGYFDDPKFIAYLKYLLYWTTPNFSHYLSFPNSITIIKLLQNENFRNELKNELFINYLHQQQFFNWLDNQHAS